MHCADGASSDEPTVPEGILFAASLQMIRYGWNNTDAAQMRMREAPAAAAVTSNFAGWAGVGQGGRYGVALQLLLLDGNLVRTCNRNVRVTLLKPLHPKWRIIYNMPTDSERALTRGTPVFVFRHALRTKEQPVAMAALHNPYSASWLAVGCDA